MGARGRLVGERGKRRTTALRILVLLLPVMLGVGGAFLAISLEKPVYRATASVVSLYPRGGGGGFVSPPRDFPAPEPVLDRVAQRADAGYVTRSWLSHHLRLTSFLGTITVSVTSDRPRTSVSVASSFGREWVRWQRIRFQQIRIRFQQIRDAMRSRLGTAPMLPRLRLVPASGAISVRAHEVRSAAAGAALGMLVGVLVAAALIFRYPWLRPRLSLRSEDFWIRMACVEQRPRH
jgi:hypothetical protein